jgi:glycosyltransferase involved in cell wall biosynthesis
MVWIRRVAARTLAQLHHALGKSSLGRRLVQRLTKMLPSRVRLLLMDDTLKIYGSSKPTSPPQARSVLIVSHELSASGAPKIVYEVARALIAADHHVKVVSPVDGPFRSLLQEAGADVVIGRRVLEDGVLLRQMAAAADVAICNTIETHPAVRLLGTVVPTFWYLHEVSLLRTRLELRETHTALSVAKRIWAGSEITAALVRPHRSDVEVFPYGLDPLATGDKQDSNVDGPLKITVFGSFAARKGQDLALDAVRKLPAPYRSRLRLRFFGRLLEENFHRRLLKAAAAVPELEICGELAYEAYRMEVLAADAVLVSSRDDTLPLVSLDALGSGRLLLCTKAIGTSAYLTNGVSGFVAERADAESIASMLKEAIDRRDDWPKIEAAGRDVFQANFSRQAFAEALIERLDSSAREERVATI